MNYARIYPSTSLYPSTTIYPFDTIYALLIFDRTQEDIDYLLELKTKIISDTATEAEIAEWNNATLKGAVNAEDLNRLGYALDWIKEEAEDCGFVVTYSYSTVKDYTSSSLPTETAVAQLLSNVSVIKTTFTRWISTDVPSNISSYANMNAVEYILYQVKDILGGASFAYRYAGDYLYSGGVY